MEEWPFHDGNIHNLLDGRQFDIRQNCRVFDRSFIFIKQFVLFCLNSHFSLILRYLLLLRFTVLRIADLIFFYLEFIYIIENLSKCFGVAKFKI